MTVERIQREVGRPVVLPADLNGVELGIGRRGAVESEIEDRNVEPREPRTKAAVGKIRVTLSTKSMSGAVGSRGVLLGELALLRVDDGRALGDSVDHQVVVAVLGHRHLEIGDPGPDRLTDREIEEPREFPPRLIRPRLRHRVRRGADPPDWSPTSRNIAPRANTPQAWSPRPA